MPNRAFALPSSDPPLSKSSVNPYMAAEARAGANAMREYMMQFGQFNQGLREAVGEVVGMVQNFQQGTGGVPVAPAETQSIQPNAAASSGIQRHAARTQRRPEASAPAPSGVEEHKRRMTFTEGREAGQSMSMRDASQNVSGYLAKTLSQHQRNWQSEPQEMVGPDGAPYQAFVEKDAAGNITRHVPFNSANPESVANAVAEVESKGGMNAKMATATGMFGRYAAGEGITGALGGTVAKVAGPIGIAVGLAAKGMDIYTDQLAAGAEFRQIYGQDAGRFAISQRLGRQGAGLESYFSGMGRARGMEAYTAAAGMGLTGDRLEAATDFDRQMFMQQGMGVQDSMRFVKMNAENSAISLEDLAKQIEQVGSSAVEAGKNSSEAIAAFASTTEMIQGTITAGAGAPIIAAGVQTAMQDSLAKRLASPEAAQAVIGGALSEQGIMRTAALTRQDPFALSTQVQLDPTGAAAQGVIADTMKQAAEYICNTGGTTSAEFRARVEQQYPGRGTRLSAGEQEQFLLKNYPRISPLTISRVFASFGINFSQADLIPQFFGAVMGTYDPLGGGGPKSPLEQIAGVGQQALQASGGVIEGGFGKLKGESDVDKTRALEGEVFGGTAGDFGALFSEPGDVAKLFGEYSGGAASSGNRNTAVEGLFTNAAEIDKAAVGSGFGEAKFNTSQGEKSLSQIMGDKTLLAELGAGKVSLVGEGGEAVDIGQWTGMGPGSKGGVTTEGAGAAGTSTPTLKLTGWAEKLFGLTGPSADQRSGTPPVATTYTAANLGR